jgi:prophage maintenance system killer protein
MRLAISSWTHTRIQSLAASYAYAIKNNHPFVEGNKRVAFVVCMLFTKLNQYSVVASQEALYEGDPECGTAVEVGHCLKKWANNVRIKEAQISSAGVQSQGGMHVMPRVQTVPAVRTPVS